MEIWRQIPGYNGMYSVSSFGRIKSYKTQKTGVLLKPYADPTNGYSYVNLRKDGKVYHRRLHKLIVMAFYPSSVNEGYDKLTTIDHKDGDKSNNRLDNLEVCTQKENNRRASSRNPRSSKSIIDIDTGEIYVGMINAARRIGLKSSNSIRRVCDGKQESCNGHRFRYLEVSA